MYEYNYYEVEKQILIRDSFFSVQGDDEDEEDNPLKLEEISLMNKAINKEKFAFILSFIISEFLELKIRSLD